MLKWSIAFSFLVPSLLGAKCVDYDSVYAEYEVSVSQVGDAGEAFDGTFVAAESCPNADEAILDVGDYYYAIVCGCLEEPWGESRVDVSLRCTVPTGTTVRWRFRGSEDHNVASESTGFDSSGDQIAGEYTWNFDTPGVYGYNCSLHSEMEGYTIDVRER